MTTLAPPVVSVRLCECGHRVWEYADGRPTLFDMTPIPHEPHPASDDDRDWIDWYIRADEALGDFAKAFADRLSLFAESVDENVTETGVAVVMSAPEMITRLPTYSRTGVL